MRRSAVSDGIIHTDSVRRLIAGSPALAVALVLLAGSCTPSATPAAQRSVPSVVTSSSTPTAPTAVQAVSRTVNWCTLLSDQEFRQSMGFPLVIASKISTYSRSCTRTTTNFATFIEGREDHGFQLDFERSHPRTGWAPVAGFGDQAFYQTDPSVATPKAYWAHLVVRIGVDWLGFYLNLSSLPPALRRAHLKPALFALTRLSLRRLPEGPPLPDAPRKIPPSADWCAAFSDADIEAAMPDPRLGMFLQRMPSFLNHACMIHGAAGVFYAQRDDYGTRAEFERAYRIPGSVRLSGLGDDAFFLYQRQKTSSRLPEAVAAVRVLVGVDWVSIELHGPMFWAPASLNKGLTKLASLALQNLTI